MIAFRVDWVAYVQEHLSVRIDGKLYEYENVSLYLFEKFKRRLQYNRGRALALIRGKAVKMEDYEKSYEEWVERSKASAAHKTSQKVKELENDLTMSKAEVVKHEERIDSLLKTLAITEAKVVAPGLEKLDVKAENNREWDLLIRKEADRANISIAQGHWGISAIADICNLVKDLRKNLWETRQETCGKTEIAGLEKKLERRTAERDLAQGQLCEACDSQDESEERIEVLISRLRRLTKRPRDFDIIRNALRDWSDSGIKGIVLALSKASLIRLSKCIQGVLYKNHPSRGTG